MTIALSPAQIRALRSEANRAGDYDQVDVCTIALGEELEEREPGIVPDRIRTMTRDAARAECARVIADASAQS